MGLGRRRYERQDTFWVASEKLGHGPRNTFYDRLNELLSEIEFDRKLEGQPRRTMRPGAAKGCRRASTFG